MLQSYPGADGMKTGYTEASGHNLVTSAVHSGVRLIGVVLGAGSNPERDAHMAVLLDQGFEQTGCAAGAPYHRGEPDAQPGRHRACRDTGGPADPPGRAIRRTAAAWAIQVGSFGSERAAREAASSARRAADGGEVRIEPASLHGRTIWRAQVTGLTAAEAQGACAALARHRSACIVLRPDQRQVASG